MVQSALHAATHWQYAEHVRVKHLIEHLEKEKLI